MKNNAILICRQIILVFIVILSAYKNTFSQDRQPYVRIAKIQIDSTHLDAYKMALKEHAETAVRVEPGVLTLYAVYDKERPTNVSVFEIYASKEAYQSHILTSHFLKYKSTVKNWVISLVLTDVIPIALETKAK